jgi:DNA-binding MarR family transcriptional regulator
MTTLRDEIRQKRPFASLEQEAHIALARTAAVLDHAIGEALKPYDITPTQYNVLRILRGAGDAGLCRNEVSERMVARVPDATRLLDRMETAGLIQRCRDEQDRRFVTTRISEEGRKLVDQLDKPMEELHRHHFGQLNREELRNLIAYLEEVRGKVCR